MDFLVPQTKKAKHRRKEILKRARKDKKVILLVDSGRLAEAFRYVDSPLTTPRSEPFLAGPPASRAGADPVPGVILPDAVTASAGHGKSRVRELAREGLLILVGEAVNTHEVEGSCLGSCRPVCRCGCCTSRTFRDEGSSWPPACRRWPRSVADPARRAHRGVRPHP